MMWFPLWVSYAQSIRVVSMEIETIHETHETALNEDVNSCVSCHFVDRIATLLLDTSFSATC